MYYPPLFPTVRPFDPRANPLEVPVKRENPLDLSNKTIRPTADAVEAEDLMMLDHRKLANLAASHSLSAMGRQLLDPTLFRLGYGADAAAAAAMLPGLTPPFCYDRTTGVAVPTSLAGHQIMTSYLQQRERLEQQHQQALYAARTNAVAQQQAAVAAAAAAYMDPANIPLHLRNGLTQREAAAALAATRGLYAPTLPTPMVLPAFSLYTDDKGAFTSLRSSGRDNAPEKSFLNGTTAASSPALEAARYAEHFQRLRELQQQHQTNGKCNNACCSTNSLAGLSQSSVPCACCVQTPSQAALCARSPLGCSTKDPTSAATGKVCDFVQPSMSFLHRPTATTTVATTAPSSSSEIRLSVSSLVTTQTTTEPTTVSSSRDKPNTGFRPTAIWNAGLPSVSTTTTTSSSNKTAFSVPKRKDRDHHKEHKSSGSIKDILKDSHNNTSTTSYETSKYDSYMKANPSVVSKPESTKRSQEKHSGSYLNEEYAPRYYPRESAEVNSFAFHRSPTVITPKNSVSNICFGGTHTTTTVSSANAVIPSKSESGSISVPKLPPLLEAVRPTEPKVSLDLPPETSTTISSPQGPPPLIAVSSTSDHIPSVTSSRPTYPLSDNSQLRMPSSLYPTNPLLMPSYKHPVEKSTTEMATSIKTSSSLSSKSPKKSSSTSSHSFTKFNGLTPSFGSEEPPPVPPSLPKPIPQLPPTHHLTASGPHLFSSHYRPAQHQLNLQSHNGWIPAANPNVTVAPLPKPVATTTTVTTITTTTSTPVVTSSHQVSKPQQTTFNPVIKREPDYADTANVLQSLLIRPAPGLEALATLPPSTVTGLATSVVTPTNNLPLFGLDYRYPFPHQLLINREGLPTASISCVPPNQINGSAVPIQHKDSKIEPIKAESNNYLPSASKHSSKKRPSATPCADDPASKKRFLASEFIASQNQTRFSLQPPSFASEAVEAPECPYTFIPEPPLNFSGQFKSEDSLKCARKDAPLVPQDVPVEASCAPKSPLSVPAKSPPPFQPQCLPQLPAATQVSELVKAVRAKRRLRKKLLARIYQQRRPLVNRSVVQVDPSVLDRQLTVRYAKKLLSQLTLRWAHRRYVHKWHSMKRRNMTKVLRLKRQRKDGKLVYKIKKEKENKKVHLQVDNRKGNETIAMPAEMKRLMVNKALGETILHRAARLGYPESVAYCLRTKCVRVNARDNAGYTPLHECCSRGHLDIARALLQYGADVNASAAGGIRPLHDAVENDHVEIVRLLLSYGADPTIATYSGLEPMKLARSPMMAEFLQGFFADISGEADSRPHLPWRFWGSAKCLDLEDCGYDVFDGVPSDPPSSVESEGSNDFLFEVSDSPHLPTFRLLLPTASTTAQCNYLRLNDVLRKLSMTKEEFRQKFCYIEILTLPSHEFEASAMCSPLLTGTKYDAPVMSRPFTTADRLMDSNGSITDLVRLDNSIRHVLGIETISVR